MEQASANYKKGMETCEAIQKRMDEIKMAEHSPGYGYDRCVYYMAKDVLNMYEYGALIVYMSKLKGRLAELNRQLEEKKSDGLNARRLKQRNRRKSRRKNG